MTKSEIIALANAGFTAAQIAAIAASPEEKPAAEPTAQPAAQPAAEPAAQPAAEPVNNVQDEILAKLGVITAAIQAGNINNSNQPQQQTADDILAEIIAPPKNIETGGK